MSRHRASIFALAMAAATLQAASASGSERNAECYANWAEAAPIVARERLVAVSDLARTTQRSMDASLVSATLCRADGRYVYRLVVREAAGGLRKVSIDARFPVLGPAGKDNGNRLR